MDKDADKQIEAIQNHLLGLFSDSSNPEKAKAGLQTYMQRQIDQGFDVNSRDKYEDTLLMWAVEEYKDSGLGRDLMEVHLSNGADVNVIGNAGETPLVKAVHWNRVEAVKALLEAGADPDMETTEMVSPLIENYYHSEEEFEEGTLEITKLLLDAGADINTRGGNFTLLTAAMTFPKCLRYLVELGMDVNAPDSGYTPLMQAIWVGDIESIRILLEAGAESQIAFETGETAFESAAGHPREDSVEILQLFLEAGAEVDARSKVSGKTALMHAAEEGCSDNARLLIEAGADVNAADHAEGMTPLMFAARGGHAEVARILVAAGADLKAKSTAGETIYDLLPEAKWRDWWLLDEDEK